MAKRKSELGNKINEIRSQITPKNLAELTKPTDITKAIKPVKSLLEDVFDAQLERAEEYIPEEEDEEEEDTLDFLNEFLSENKEKAATPEKKKKLLP